MNSCAQNDNEDIAPWIAGSVVHRLSNPLGAIPVRVELLQHKLAETLEHGGSLDTEYFRRSLEWIRSDTQYALRAVDQDSALWLAQAVRHRLEMMLNVILAKVELIEIGLEEGIPEAKHLPQKLDEIKGLAGSAIRVLRRLRVPGDEIRTVLTAETVDLRHLISEVIDRCSIPQNVELYTEFTSQPLLIVNRQAVAEVLINVLMNAVEAMPDGGQLRVTSHVAKDQHHAEIHIADTGCGIQEDLKPTLFAPFVSTKGGGEGIGLWLSKQLLQRMGGDIYLKHSQAGEGSTFVVTIPIAESSERSGANECGSKSSRS